MDISFINKAIELNSDENWLQLAQGECYCELKEYDKALKVYDTILKNQNKAIQLLPNNKKILDLMNEIRELN